MKRILSLAVLSIAALTMANHANAQIVLFDTFDDGDLTVNASGVGGGFNSGTGGQTATPFLEQNNELDTNPSAGGGNNARAFSINSFDLSPGFTLEVNFGLGDLSDPPAGGAPFPSNSFSFGLLDVADNSGGNFFSNTDAAAASLHGIGLGTDGLGTAGETVGLNFIDNGTIVNLSDGVPGSTNANAQEVATGTGQNFLLTVDAAGAVTFSLNGGGPITGTVGPNFFTDAAGNLRDFQFAASSQGGDGGSNIQDVTLTILAPPAVPEPSSLALLGFASLGLISRRRRS